MPALLNEKAIEKRFDDRFDELANRILVARLDGISWTYTDFRKICCFNHTPKWVKKNILNPFKKEIEYTGKTGWVIWSIGQGSPYRFRAKKACEWIETNFERINWDAPEPTK